MIIRFIKKCCISNAKDGTEDDAILKEDGEGHDLDTDYVHPDVSMKAI